MSAEASPFNTRYFLRPRRAEGLIRSPGGLELGLDTGERLRVDVLGSDLLRLKISRGGSFDEQPTHAVLPAALASRAPVAFTVDAPPGEVRLSTASLCLRIGTAPFRLDAHRADGSLLFETALDAASGEPCAYATLNDAWTVARRCAPDDSFYGLGEKTGRFDRRGRDFQLWNTDVINPNVAGEYRDRFPGDDPRGDPRSTAFDPYYVSIPFFYHHPAGGSAMAGFFFDNNRRAHVEFDSPTEYRLHFEGGQYTEYVFAGPHMRDILRDYTALTGRIEPPPLWALGHHQCRWHPYTQKSFGLLAEQYREREIPCDTLWLDIDYMDGYRVFTWNQDAFPSPQTMLAHLRAQGFRVITIIDPGVKFEPGNPIFEEAVTGKLLCQTPEGGIYAGQVWPGRTAFPDFSLAETRRWWGRLNAAHVQSGLAGIWNDMNEPATGDIPADAMWFGHGTRPHAQVHNEYALLMAMGTVEGLRAAMPAQRTFVLSRAGSPGIQRYAANWLGDNCSRWDHLWLSLPMAMGFGVSGQPFVGADVGGFIENTTAELLARWYQYGALTPFCRNHNCANQIDQYPWSFDDETLAICRQAILRRYQLLPYLYAAFFEAAETGAPIQRPLVYDHPDHEATRGLDDQYLLGSHLLVAPVYHPGQTRRRLYLPPGTWHAWNGDANTEIFAGSRWLDTPAPLGRIPLYARGGAVVPTWPDPPLTTMDHRPEAVGLHVFLPTEDGTTVSFLHEDDGTTFAFRDGAFLRTAFRLTRAGHEVTLSATVTGGGYPEFARRRFVVTLHGASVGEVTVDGVVCPSVDGRLTFANPGTNFELRVRVE